MEVEIEPNDGDNVAGDKQRLSLTAMPAPITPDNLHPAQSWGVPEGKEVMVNTMHPCTPRLLLMPCA